MYSENTFINYYTIQSGGGISDIGPLYYNQRIVQQGRGIGNFFAALYRYLKPVFISGLGALKNQAFKTGSAILEDLGKKPFKEVIVERGKQAFDELGDQIKNKFQDGSGLFSYRSNSKKYKKAKLKKTKIAAVSNKKKKLKDTKKKKNKIKTRILDIFSKS